MKANDIVNLIISYDWSGSIIIEDLILEISYKLISDAEIREKVIDDYADEKSKNFQKLIRQIESVNKSNNAFQRINLTERVDGYYLEKQNENPLHGKKYNEVINLINAFEKLNNKGVVYENFCKLFLEDLGISCKLTAKTNDKGIDILGSFKIKLSEEIGDLVFNEEIYLLIQTKYFNKKIDTPVIRKLVGDSLFIRFDELEYIEIRHNAFHLIVFSHLGFTEPAIKFAEKNKIKLFNSTNIAHIISEKPEKKWTCLEINMTIS
jgi:HJR/Mrr/RecB family endonuclease